MTRPYCCLGEKTMSEESGDTTEVSHISSFTCRRRTRGCTDILTLCIFTVFGISLFVIAAYGVSYGDIYKLLYPSDSFGNFCGRKNPRLSMVDNGTRNYFPLSGTDLTGKKFAFPLNFRQSTSTFWICVSQCPSIRIDDRNAMVDYLTNVDNICTYDTDDFSRLSWNDFFNTGPCPALPSYPMIAKWNRCLPQLFQGNAPGIINRYLYYMWKYDFIRMVTFDLLLVWKEICVICGISLILSLLMSLLLKYFYRTAIHAVFAAGTLLLAGVPLSLGALFVHRCLHENDKSKNGTITMDHYFSDDTALDLRSHFVLMLISLIISIILLVHLYSLWPKRKLIIDLFILTKKTLEINPWLIIQPITTAISLLIFLIVWGTIAVHLFTTTVPMMHTIKTMGSVGFREKEASTLRYEYSKMVRVFIWIHWLAFLWILGFIFAAQRMVVAGAVACGYFSKKKLGYTWPIINSTLLLFRFHLGSIALGSLVLFVVTFPRWIIIEINNGFRNGKGCFRKLLNACFGKVFRGLELWLRPLHHNAYTVVAISGTDFFSAAGIAADVLDANADKIPLINKDGGFLIFFSKAAVSLLTGFIAAYRFKFNSELEFWVFPTLICVFVAYAIANSFLSIYEMVFDTLFVCFAEEVTLVETSGGTMSFKDERIRQFMDETIVVERSLGIRSDLEESSRTWRNTGRTVRFDRRTQVMMISRNSSKFDDSMTSVGY
ncbi:hypothetical protein FO519_007743 [Halicephalobus sp. NKZ332]|nr:hypothetical protein FO519_007743 [Halicephalobus sp. NKZ332]